MAVQAKGRGKNMGNQNVLQWNKPGRTMTVALEVAQAIALEQALADLEEEE